MIACAGYVPTPRGLPHTPLPGLLHGYGQPTAPAWPTTLLGSMGLMGVGVALALFGPQGMAPKLAATAAVVWGGYRVYRNATDWLPGL